MVFVSRNMRSREMGIQTYARACRLMPELREAELDYLSVRDYYMNMLARLAQFEEAFEQAKLSGTPSEIAEFKHRVYSLQGALKGERKRLQEVAEKSYAEAFFLCAKCMLPDEVRKTIELETEKLLGRPRHELHGS